MTLLLALLLAADPAMDDAGAHLQKGLELSRAGDAAGARSECLAAFLLDPERPAPPECEPAQAEAIATLKTRLADAAANAVTTFSMPVTVVSSSGDEAVTGRPVPMERATTPKPPEVDQGPRPLALGGRLTVGGYGFYVIGESSGGPALELGFGVNLGPIRVGGIAALMIGGSLAATLAARVSTISEKKVAYLAALDLGVFYGGENGVFAPFLTLHPVGVRFRAGRLGLELHALSCAIYYVSKTFRFAPQLGLAVLL